MEMGIMILRRSLRLHLHPPSPRVKYARQACIVSYLLRKAKEGSRGWAIAICLPGAGGPDLPCTVGSIRIEELC